MRLDQVLRRLSDGVDPEKLAASAKWGQLVSMRQSLQRLLPEDHPDFNKRGGATMDFNGVQVSFITLEEVSKNRSRLFQEHFHLLNN